jgi:putative inorganic carbon (HCO3(-)) transporter
MDFPFIAGKNFAFRIIIEFSAVFWLGLIYLRKEYRISSSPLSVFILLFTFIVGLANLHGVNPYNSFWSSYERMEGYMTILHLTLYFVIIKSILKTERDWKIYFNLFIIAGLLVSILAFLLPSASDISPEFGSEYISRVYSTIGNPPFLASYMLLLVFIGFILFFISDKKYFRFIYVLPVSFFFVTIYFTASRGVILSIVIGFIIFSVFVFINKTNILKIKKHKKVVVYCVVITVIAAVLFMSLISDNFLKHDEIFSRFTSLKSDKSVTTRLNTWKMAWNGVKERPMLGWGQENFYSIYTVNHIPAYEGIVLIDRAHNIIIDWMINAGLMGLFSYLAIFGSAFYIVFTSYHRKIITKSLFITFLIVLLTYFIQNLFTFDTINTYMLFFVLLAYIDSINRKHNEKTPCENDKVDTRNIQLKSIAVILPVLVLVSFLLYYANYKPIRTSQLSLRISKDFPQYKSLKRLGDDFNKALSYKTFGSTYVRTKMAEASLQIMKHKLFEIEGAYDFIRQTRSELLKGAKENYNNLRYLSHMIQFFYAVARLDPSFNDETAKIIKKCLQIAPYYEEFKFKLAEVYLLKKDYERAFAIIDKAVSKDTQNDRKQFKLSEVAILVSKQDVVDRALGKIGKIRKAENTEIAAGRKPVFSANEFIKLAETYIEIKNFGKAIEFYKEIISISPQNAKYHFEIAELYWKIGDKANAQKEAFKALEIDPLKYNGKTRYILSDIISP